MGMQSFVTAKLMTICGKSRKRFSEQPYGLGLSFIFRIREPEVTATKRHSVTHRFREE
jgi:hypothetical protein